MQVHHPGQESRIYRELRLTALPAVVASAVLVALRVLGVVATGAVLGVLARTAAGSTRARGPARVVATAAVARSALRHGLSSHELRRRSLGISRAIT